MNLFDADNLEAATALLELQWQFRASRALMTAHQLGVFEAIREPRPAAEVARAYHCHRQTVYSIRQRFVEQGFEAAVGRKKRSTPPVAPKMDGRTQARLVALACEETPEGVSRWSLRLLSDRMVDLGVVASLSHETVRRTLKKTNCVPTCETAG